jgi:hypothetical protein
LSLFKGLPDFIKKNINFANQFDIFDICINAIVFVNNTQNLRNSKDLKFVSSFFDEIVKIIHELQKDQSYLYIVKFFLKIEDLKNSAITEDRPEKNILIALWDYFY